MNISNHCFQRYHERVRKSKEPFVDSLKEKYTKELNTLYKHCKKIYSGIIGHSTKPVDVYVNNHGWVIISSDKEELLITLYKIDLGVDDDELNKKYIETSLKKIDNLENKLAEKTVQIIKDKKEFEEKIESNEVLIKEYQKTVNDLKEQNENYKDLIKLLSADLYKEQTDLRDAIENYMVKDVVKIDLEVK